MAGQIEAGSRISIIQRSGLHRGIGDVLVQSSTDSAPTPTGIRAIRRLRRFSDTQRAVVFKDGWRKIGGVTVAASLNKRDALRVAGSQLILSEGKIEVETGMETLIREFNDLRTNEPLIPVTLHPKQQAAQKELTDLILFNYLITENDMQLLLARPRRAIRRDYELYQERMLRSRELAETALQAGGLIKRKGLNDVGSEIATVIEGDIRPGEIAISVKLYDHKQKGPNGWEDKFEGIIKQKFGNEIIERDLTPEEAAKYYNRYVSFLKERASLAANLRPANS